MPLCVGAQELSGKAPKCHALTIIESSYSISLSQNRQL